MAWHTQLTGRSERTVAKTSTAATVAVVGAVVAALYLGRAIAIPIAIAVLISFSLGPLVIWLRRRHVGRVLSVVIVVGPALLAVGAFAYLITTQIGHLADNIPSYQVNMERKLGSIQAKLPARGMLQRGSEFFRSLRSHAENPDASHSEGLRSAPDKGRFLDAQGEGRPVPVEIREPNPTSIDLLRSVLGPLVQPVGDAGVVLLFVVFFLVERETLRDRVIKLAGASDLHRTTMAMDEAGYRVSRFLLRQLVVNLLFGITIGLGLLVIGVPNAPLWGGMAAVLRFIPYLGVMAAAFLPLALAFVVDPGWAMLVWTGGWFLGVELLVANVVEPWLYGSSTGLSSVAIVVSAIFWTWLWGSIGLLLATPLTVCIAVLGRYVPQIAFLEVLLGSEAPLQPEESFYQRLLAGDPDEATAQAEEFLKSGSLELFYDQVGLPALALAERDRARGVLDDEHRHGIVSGLEIVFENLEEPPVKPGRRGTAGPAARDAGIAKSANQALGRTILCVAGRGDLDEAAASMLAQILVRDGYDARTVSLESALRPFLDGRELPNAAIICLSYMNADSVPHARYLGRRFRKWLGGDVAVVVGFWGADESVPRDENLQAVTDSDAVVTTLQAAHTIIGARLAEAQLPATLDEPILSDLATRASEVVSQTA